MGLYTNFLRLFKPNEAEKYDINVFNKNVDLIDSALEQLNEKNKSQDELLNTKASNSTDGFLSKEDYIKYEDANDKKHKHDNKSVLDKLAESENGNLLYNGKEINSGTDNIGNDHNHGYMKTITLSETEPTSISDGEIIMVYEE